VCVLNHLVVLADDSEENRRFTITGKLIGSIPAKRAPSVNGPSEAVV
jgi:hypothetical protein